MRHITTEHGPNIEIEEITHEDADTPAERLEQISEVGERSLPARGLNGRGRPQRLSDSDLHRVRFVAWLQIFLARFAGLTPSTCESALEG
jgi:hypothetical protein